MASGTAQQMALSPTMCFYQMEGDGRFLEVTAMVRAFATQAAASEFYDEFTRDVSPGEMAERLQELGVDTDDPFSIADRSVAARLKDGIRFENVGGIADQARFDASDGTLHLRRGTMVLGVSAFHGPPPTLPTKVTPETMADAEAAWKAEAMELRRRQAADLAQAVLMGF